MKQGYISCTVLEYLSMKFQIPVSEEEQQEKKENKEAETGSGENRSLFA